MSELDLMQIARIITPNYLMGDVLQLGEADHDFEKSILVNALNELQKIRTGLCPRQVLGVRLGMLAGRLLNLGLPQMNKRLIAFMETDSCALDGVVVATGCRVG